MPPSPPAESVARGVRPGLAAALLVVLAVPLYAPALAGPFLFDDIPLIQGNTWIHGFEHWWRWLSGDLWDTNFVAAVAGGARGFWRPLVLASYASDWSLGGGEPFLFHLTNLLVHGLNAALCMLWLRSLKLGPLPAFFGALLFLSHPIQTETVAWISGRTDSFACLGLLLTTLGFAYRLEGSRWGFGMEVLGLVVAFGSKESAIVLPVLLGLVIWARQGATLSTLPVRSFFKLCWPHLMVVAVYLGLHTLYVRTEVLAFGTTPFNRLLLFFEVYGRFAALLVWPDDLTLGRGLFRFQKDVIVPYWGYVASGAVLIGGLAAWMYRERHTAKASSLLGFAVFCMLLPISGISWLDYDVIVSPRFFYVPMLAVAALLALLIERARSHHTKAIVAVGTTAMLAFGLRSFVRARDFSSEQAFWRSEITANPRYTSAQGFFIGRALTEGRPRAALEIAHASFRRLESAGDPDLARAGLIVPALSALVSVTPDLERDTLAALARFLQDLRHARDASLHLPQKGISLRVPSRSLSGLIVRNDAHRLRVMEADTHSRLGNDERAIAVLTPLLQQCAECWPLTRQASLIAARAQRFQLAQRFLAAGIAHAPPGTLEDAQAATQAAYAIASSPGRVSGLKAVQLYASLGAYGRAYSAAQPMLQQPSLTPDVRLILAELAVRAGDAPAAKKLLTPITPQSQLDLRLHALKVKGGRVDAARPEGQWEPFGLSDS